MGLRKVDAELVEDERAFDAAVIRGALGLYNALHSDAAPQSQTLGAIVTDSLGWLPDVLAARAKAAGIDPANVHWASKESGMDVMDAAAVLLYTVGAFGDREAKTMFQLAPTQTGRKRPSPEAWMDSILRALPIYTRLVWDAGTVRTVSVPCLTSVQRTVAYAMALLWADKHGFRERVRPCQLLIDPKPGSLAHHYFLADDLRQKCCCPAHTNTLKQRVHRRNQSERKHP